MGMAKENVNFVAFDSVDRDCLLQKVIVCTSNSEKNDSYIAGYL